MDKSNSRNGRTVGRVLLMGELDGVTYTERAVADAALYIGVYASCKTSLLAGEIFMGASSGRRFDYGQVVHIGQHLSVGVAKRPMASVGLSGLILGAGLGLCSSLQCLNCGDGVTGRFFRVTENKKN